MGTGITGTREWAAETVNILRGCSHNCRYCYARAMALRRGQIKCVEEWAKPVLREKEVRKRRKKVDGTVMFPSTHDILPCFLERCLEVISRILLADNRLLIVSKPDVFCIEQIVEHFRNYRERILFRFTITSLGPGFIDYWEPGAPPFEDRFAALALAFHAGWSTSVSVEPMLQSDRIVELLQTVDACVTDTIWIGKMNQIDSRVVPGTDPAEIARIKAGQTDERIWEIYNQLKDHPKVRWKDSIKRVVGIPLSKKLGGDA